MKEVLRNSNFVKLWLGQLVSLLGDQIHFIALMVLIQNIYGNIVITGTVMMVTAIPKVIFSPFAGVLVDRWPLKKTMIISDLLRMLLVLSIPFIFNILEITSMSIIFLITFLISTVSVFFYPAEQASIPTIVKKENLLEANTLTSTTQSVISILGYVGGAVLVSLIGTTWVFIIDSLTFLTSAMFVVTINYPKKEVLEKNSNSKITEFFQEFKSGATYVFNNSLLKFILFLLASLLLVAGAVNVLVFAYIDEVLHQDTSIVGYIYGANMFGMLLGMLLISKITKKYPKEKVLVFCTFIFAFSITCYSFIETLLILTFIVIINGIGNAILNVINNTILQESTDETMRGRVFSFMNSIVNSASIISMLPAAWLASKFGVQNVFLVSGLLILLIGFVSLYNFNKIFSQNNEKIPKKLNINNRISES